MRPTGPGSDERLQRPHGAQAGLRDAAIEAIGGAVLDGLTYAPPHPRGLSKGDFKLTNVVEAEHTIDRLTEFAPDVPAKCLSYEKLIADTTRSARWFQHE